MSVGTVCIMNAEILLLSSEANVNVGTIWLQNKTSPSTRQRVLADIQRVYPSVLTVDDVLIVTWDHISETHIHNGKVSYNILKDYIVTKCHMSHVTIFHTL